MTSLKINVSLLLLTASCSTQENRVHPETKPLMEAVYASGFVRAQNEYEVFSQGEGYVLEKLVNDGDTLRKGDPLYVLDAGQQSARYQIAKDNYTLAVRNASIDSPVLSELSALISTSESKKNFDSVNYIRYSNLLQQNATPRVEYDRAKLAFENSRNEWALQKSRYRKMKSDLELARETTQQQLIIASDESSRHVVRSQAKGMVIQTRKEKGELMRRGESVATMGESDSFYIELSVDELDLNKVKIGQVVLVKADAFADHVFHATITKVYPLVDVRQQSLRVDAAFTEKLPVVFSGLAIEANIIIQQKENALVVPKSVLLSGDSIWIERGGGEIKIKVVRGIETLDEVEIVSGLEKESLIIIK